MSGKRKALFLDRDGTINIDRVYIADPELIELIPGAAAAIHRAKKAGYLIVVVTNQSGVGRGLIDPKVLPKIHARLDKLLEKEGTKIDQYQICIHAPMENCDCRKPFPKLVEDAAEELEIDLKTSAFIGDKLTDVATGNRAKCGASILVRTGKGKAEEMMLVMDPTNVPAEERPTYVADDLSSAVDWLLNS